MNIFFDTSVLVSAFMPRHQRHDRAYQRLTHARSARHRMLTSTHSLAELYAALTSIPSSPRIAPVVAARMIHQNLDDHAEICPITPADYRTVIDSLAAAGLSGGVIYDALALRAAIRGGADLVLTLNPRDFRRLPEAGAIEIAEP